jgi:hypothetical protein
VIGGFYNGSATETFYRVDFVGAGNVYMPLLRNHSYNVEIQEVKAPGYPSAEDAYNAKPVNIVVEITAWNDGDLKESTFNGQYEISVDKSALQFHAEGAPKSLLVYTDYPGGWTVEEAGLPSWLTVTVPAPAGGVASGAAGATTTLTLEADPTGTLPRSGEFYIVAGNLRKKITVTQGGEAEFSLEVTPQELRFYKTPAGPKPVSVISYPATLERVFSDAGTITWSIFPPPTGSSSTSYLFQPDPNPAASTLGNTVLVKVEQNGQVLTRPVIVTQLGREMIYSLVPANPYPAAAGNYTLTVVSEEPWRLGIDSDPDNMLALPAEDGVTLHPAALAPYTYTFTLAGMTGGYTAPPRQAGILLYSPDLPAAGVPYTIVQSSAPYIVITDPASKVIDFGGSAAGDRTATFKTNAGWKFITDANFSRVVADARSAGSSIMPIPVDNGETGDQAGGVSATDVHEGAVVFTPVDVATAAGGDHETVVTFETVDGGAATGAPVGTDQLTLKRSVPVIWEFLGSTPVDGSTVVAKANTVTLSARTNVNWWGQRGTAAKVNKSVTAYEPASTLNVSVPKRPTNNTISWTAGNDLITTITTGYGASAEASISVTQPPYTISVTVVNGGTGAVTGLDRDGGTISVTFSTTAPDYYIQLKSNGQWIGTEQHFTTSNPNVQTVSFPLNDEVASTRNLEIWNKYGQRLWAGTITQGGYDGFWYLLSVTNNNYNTYLAGYSCPANYTKVMNSLTTGTSYAEGSVYYVDGTDYSGGLANWTNIGHIIRGSLQYFDGLHFMFSWRGTTYDKAKRTITFTSLTGSTSVTSGAIPCKRL